MTMRKRHRELLSVNNDFLVNEIPVDQTLEAIRNRNILSRHDFDQIRTLRHQGRKAMARYLLAVLPQRGEKAFEAFLESLVEANAQHLVDLLLQNAGVRTVEDLLQFSGEDNPGSTPSDTPLPLGPDPHEYVVRLTRNNKLIRRFVDPAKISPVLAQNKVMTSREADMVLHLHGKNKKWDLIMAVLLQRGERAYQAFMASLLKNEYSTVFHTINETPTGKRGSDDECLSLSDEADEYPVYDENLNSDEEIKQEVTQIQQEMAAREEKEDDLDSGETSKSDDTMLKMSSDLADVSVNDLNFDGDHNVAEPDAKSDNRSLSNGNTDDELRFTESIDNDGADTISYAPTEHGATALPQNNNASGRNGADTISNAPTEHGGARPQNNNASGRNGADTISNAPTEHGGARSQNNY